MRLALSAAAARLSRAGWAVEDGARRGGVAARGAAEVARWPFERAVWAAERGVVWPLRERLAGRQLPANAAGVAALVAVALVATLAGVLLSRGGGGSEAEPAAAPARVAVAPPPARPPAAKTKGPALQGVPPSFEGEAAAEQAGSPGGVAAGGSGSDEATAEGGEDAAAASGTATAGEAAATSSAAKPVPAGREAMKVARRFSNAFVFYEVGEHPARAKAVFGETASPQLAEALAERPPRLPQGAKVPKAKVLNLVPGPRRGRSYTVSVSLLRLGVTSELRLSLAHNKSEGWRVVNVLG